MDKYKCEGKRYQRKGKAWGVFKCSRKATGIVETHVGMTNHRYCCDSVECFNSITCYYPCTFTPLQKERQVKKK